VARRVERTGGSVIVYDDRAVSHVHEDWFSPAHWPDAGRAGAAGRGSALSVRYKDREWVLRHYHRGGLPGRFVNDRYFWAGEARTRSFREWDLLYRLSGMGLPVPQPVAARYCRYGWAYTADLITERLAGVTALSERLAAGPMPGEGWRALGATLAGFHRALVFHADLNAHNIQVGADGRFYLLDFDRGRIMAGPGRWRHRNLHRLRRSLVKISGQGGSDFDTAGWAGLEAAYRVALIS